MAQDFCKVLCVFLSFKFYTLCLFSPSLLLIKGELYMSAWPGQISNSLVANLRKQQHILKVQISGRVCTLCTVVLTSVSIASMISQLTANC